MVKKVVTHKLTAEEERAMVLGGIEHHIEWVRALIEGEAVWRGFDELGLPRQGIEGPLGEIEMQVAALQQEKKP
jgi:hypothetical protein